MAAIIFDFDGTLADSFNYVSDFLAGQAGIAKLNEQQRQDLHGRSINSMVRHLGFRWWQWPGLLLKGRRRMRRAIRNLQTFDGLPELLRKLHAEGHELFIVSTNSLPNLRRFLKAKKVNKYFLQIYGGVGLFGKAAALRQVLHENSLEPNEAVYIGDESRDIDAANEVGIRGVAVSWGFSNPAELKAAKPTVVIDTPEQLLRYLEEI